MTKHRERPVKRTNPSGKTVWVARYTNPQGKRVIAKPKWNGGHGTFERQRDAQRAIDEAYDLPATLDTVGAYFEKWSARHPRSRRTNGTNEHRITRVLDVVIEGVPLRDWALCDLRRRHASALIEHMLVQQGRATTGAANIMRSLSAMAEDAITDEVCDLNPFKGLRIRATDPRATKPRRPIRVFSYEEMHRFARCAGAYEPLVRMFSDAGLRLGEALPLERSDFDGEVFLIRRTAHEGEVWDGTKTDHQEPEAGRVVPCPPSLAALIRGMPARLGTSLLFTTPTGKLWRERNFYRDVWNPARQKSGLDICPKEMRHSYISHLRAAGVDDADLADIAGHRVETMLSRYTHGLGRSFDRVRQFIG